MVEKCHPDIYRGVRADFNKIKPHDYDNVPGVESVIKSAINREVRVLQRSGDDTSALSAMLAEMKTENAKMRAQLETENANLKAKVAELGRNVRDNRNGNRNGDRNGNRNGDRSGNRNGGKACPTCGLTHAGLCEQ